MQAAVVPAFEKWKEKEKMRCTWALEFVTPWLLGPTLKGEKERKGE
jgi:hypothetical protein